VLSGCSGQIAAVAYDRPDPAVRAKVDALIKLNPDYSKWIGGVADANPERFAFVHASTWADDIKGEDGYTDSGDTRLVTTRRETSAMPITGSQVLALSGSSFCARRNSSATA
jgi:hypothetical protein